jgi:hypothetical protein
MQTGSVIVFNHGDSPEWAKRLREEMDREILARLDQPLDEATTGPIIADLITTLGVTREQAEEAVRWNTTPAGGDGGHMAAEQVQQCLHDLFVAPTWPPCPEHVSSTGGSQTARAMPRSMSRLGSRIPD